MPRKKKQTNVGTAISPSVTTPILEQVVGANQTNEEIFRQLGGAIQESVNQRGPWNQKRATYYRMRMRMRKDKPFPFDGCSNLRMPTVEKYIRKLKAALFNVIWGISPHAVVIPEPSGNPDAASKLEYYLDWCIDVKVKLAKKLIILIDKMLEKGFSFAEVIWKMEDEVSTFSLNLDELPQEVLNLIFSAQDDEQIVNEMAQVFEIDMSETVRTENTEAILKALGSIRNGSKSVEVQIHDETYNNVDVVMHDPEMVYVPVDTGINPQDARFIALEVYEPWDVVKSKANKGIYDKSVMDEMTTFRGLGNPPNPAPSQGRSSINQNNTTMVWEDMREGIERVNNPSHNVKLWRVYAWYDLDGDGIEERCVFIMAPEWKKVLAKFPFPYSHRKWPVVRFDAEMIDDRWFSSRGIPEIIEDIVKEIDTQHNQKLDQQTIRNTPMFTFRSGVVNPRLVKFIPGQAIPVPGVLPLDDAVKILRNESTNAEYSYRDEEMLLKLEVQELLGAVDYGLQSTINRREPRTSGEVQLQSQSANTLFSLDVANFAESTSEMFTQMVQLIQQFLPQEVYFSVVGEGEPIRLGREEIEGGYIVRVRGNDINTNAQTRMKLNMMRQQYLANPIYLQSGIVTPVELYNLAKQFLQDSGEVNFQKYVSMPQPPPPPQPPPAITHIKPKYADLTDHEQAQVLASGGIEPDMHGRALEREQEIVGEHMEEPAPTNGASSNGQ